MSDDGYFMQQALNARANTLGADLGTGAALVSPNHAIVHAAHARLPRKLSMMAAPCGCAKATEFKDNHMLHAEIAVLIQASGVVVGWTAYVTRFPCAPCASALIEAGISRVVAYPLDPDSRWFKSQFAALEAFMEARVVVDIYNEEDHK